MLENRKIKKNNLADQVFEAIRKSIKDKEWEQGSKLPSEASLAKMYGVNRLTIRIALQKLNAKGILETRAGEGTFVREFDFIKYINDVSDMIMSPHMLEGVWEFRRYFELECIRLSIQKAGEAEIKRLEKKYNAFEKIVREKSNVSDEHIHQIVEADLAFHYEICKSTKNPLFSLAFVAAREPIYQYIKSRIANGLKNIESEDIAIELLHSRSLDNHKLIMNGIKNRDYKLCEKVYFEMTDYNNP
ncbi:MAG: GntR family transcriptional regulator [Desulfobacteraceae bacterium]|jgi:GntR family transcriptional repressor for pyruvate dehydrogenase complex